MKLCFISVRRHYVGISANRIERGENMTDSIILWGLLVTAATLGVLYYAHRHQ